MTLQELRDQAAKLKGDQARITPLSFTEFGNQEYLYINNALYNKNGKSIKLFYNPISEIDMKNLIDLKDQALILGDLDSIPWDTEIYIESYQGDKQNTNIPKWWTPTEIHNIVPDVINLYHSTIQLTERIKEHIFEEDYPGLSDNLMPFKEYTPEEIENANLILINSKDHNYQLIFEEPTEVERETLQYYNTLDYSDLPILDIYIY